MNARIVRVSHACRSTVCRSYNAIFHNVLTDDWLGQGVDCPAFLGHQLRGPPVNFRFTGTAIEDGTSGSVVVDFGELGGRLPQQLERHKSW